MNFFFLCVFFTEVLTVENPSAVAMCDLKANQLIFFKKGKFKKKLVALQKHFEPLSEADFNCGFPVQNMGSVEQFPQRLEVIWPPEEIVWVTTTFSLLPSLHLPLSMAHPLSP